MTGRDQRLLAIDLSSRGFGFAMFGDPDHPVDWGTKRVSGEKYDKCVTAVRALILKYEPDILALQDMRSDVPRRPERTRELSRAIARMGRAEKLHVVRVPWSKVRSIVGLSTSATKEQITTAIAHRFPGLGRCRPPTRKLWMSEDDRMNMFDAVALGVTAYVLIAGGW